MTFLGILFFVYIVIGCILLDRRQKRGGHVEDILGNICFRPFIKK